MVSFVSIDIMMGMIRNVYSSSVMFYCSVVIVCVFVMCGVWWVVGFVGKEVEIGVGVGVDELESDGMWKFLGCGGGGMVGEVLCECEYGLGDDVEYD